MVATLCLFSMVLVTAQSPARGEWLLAPRLARAQELVYGHGVYIEETNNGPARCTRAFRLDHRVFVLDVTSKGTDVALLTLLRPREGAAEGGRDVPPLSVRLEVIRLDAQGRILSPNSGTLSIPFDGPPTIECGHFVEVPRGRTGLNQAWPAGEEGRPPRTWQAVGTETISGVACVKLVGVQQSDDWEHPRGDHTAWHRQDTVWIETRDGIAQKVERVVQRREPGHVEPTLRSTLTYELVSSVEYPNKHYEVRKNEILQARDFWERAQPCLANPAKHTAELDAVLERIKAHLSRTSPTPYREAVLRVQHRVEAARKGEAFVAPETPAPQVTIAAIGKAAPDFAVPDFSTRDSVRFRNWVGKPILLVFYSPTSVNAGELLRFAQGMHERHHDVLHVVGLAISDDAELVRKQRAELGLAFPTLDGSGLRLTYQVHATPKLVLIDAAGLVQGAYVGWGPELQQDVTGELEGLLAGKKKAALPPR